MKKLKYIIIVYLVISSVIVTCIIMTCKNDIKFNCFKEEPVIENKISIKAKEIHDYIRENNYGYCTYDNRCNHEGECSLNVVFENSKTGHQNTCCATYVSWVLQETGYLTKEEHIDNYLNGANNLIKYLQKKGWKVVDKKDIMPGDILCYNGHIAIYGGNGKQYDAGNKQMIETVAPCKLYCGMDTEKILRATDIM